MSHLPQRIESNRWKCKDDDDDDDDESEYVMSSACMCNDESIMSRLTILAYPRRWELQSSVPGMGLLLRKYAPHDVYTIWKQVSQGFSFSGSLAGIGRASWAGALIAINCEQP